MQIRAYIRTFLCAYECMFPYRSFLHPHSRAQRNSKSILGSQAIGMPLAETRHGSLCQNWRIGISGCRKEVCFCAIPSVKTRCVFIVFPFRSRIRIARVNHLRRTSNIRDNFLNFLLHINVQNFRIRNQKELFKEFCPKSAQRHTIQTKAPPNFGALMNL